MCKFVLDKDTLLELHPGEISPKESLEINTIPYRMTFCYYANSLNFYGGIGRGDTFNITFKNRREGSDQFLKDNNNKRINTDSALDFFKKFCDIVEEDHSIIKDFMINFKRRMDIVDSEKDITQESFDQIFTLSRVKSARKK